MAYSSTPRKQGQRGCCPFPLHPKPPPNLPPLRSGQSRLTIPNTSSTITMPASLRSDCCSPSLRNPVRLRPEYPLNTRYWDIAKRTASTISLEGGNDLVLQPLIRARLGMLDLEWFKQEVRYCRLPNGVANDRVRQSGGRYAQSLDFDFMMHMGFWCENFSLPAVLNECMMQSYAGHIRIFPNTHNLGPARFENLRAVCAFLVSATYDGHKVT